MNERDLEQFRQDLVKKYQDLLEQDRRVLTDAEYQKFLKRQQEIQEIEMQIKKLELSLGCAYGDYDCDNCSDINEETVCKIKLQNIILAKINEVIGVENE